MMPGAHQIAADVLPAADQITQLLMLDRRNRHERNGHQAAVIP